MALIDKDLGSFRGSEVAQLDISLQLKNWIIHKIIIFSPLIFTIVSYLLYKFFIFINYALDDKNVDDFSFFDRYFFVFCGVGIIATIFIGKKLGNRWLEITKKVEEELIKDEYIRGSKLVCVDDFNKQFDNMNDKFLKFKVIEKECKRTF